MLHSCETTETMLQKMQHVFWFSYSREIAQ